MRIGPDWIAAVAGSPVAHSLSPAIHGTAFRLAGRTGTYGVIECDAQGAPALVASLRGSRLVGVSATMPLKEVLAPLCDELDSTARSLGAVNCLSLADGRVTGHNTDGDGCAIALETVGGARLRGAVAVVLGAGGTARSVALALARRGSHVVIVNRTRERADVVAAIVSEADGVEGSAEVGPESIVADADVVVNATSVGMGTDESPLESATPRTGAVVLDAVYHPLRTRFLRDAAAAGAECVDGLWMLVHQARIQQGIWFGSMPDALPLRESAREALAARE